MSSSQQSLMTPREIDQTRRLVIAFDLATWSVILSYLALASNIIFILFQNTSLAAVVAWLAPKILPFQFWLSAAASAISVASAFLFLGAPLRMRSFHESLAFAVLTLLSTIVFSVGAFMRLPTLFSFAGTAITLFLIPIVLVLLFRKAAIFSSSNEDLVLGRSIARLMFVGAMLVEFGLRLLDFINYFSFPPEFMPLAVLTPILPLLLAIVCFALILIRLFRLQLSLGRKFKQLCNDPTRIKASSSSSQKLPTAELRAESGQPRSSKDALNAQEGRFSPIPFGVSKLLAALVVVVLVCELGSFLIDRAKSIDRERIQFAESAKRFNSQLWLKVRAPVDASEIDSEAILRMESICARLSEPMYLNTLGVAQYRVGDYAAAKDSLERSLNASKSLGDPSDLAFLAMSHYKLGQKDVAKNIRSRLSDLMKLDRYKNNPESRGFEQEVNTLFEAGD